MKKTYGNFIEKVERQEYLILSFSSDTLTIKDRWRNNSLSADFLANYWGNFFPIHDTDSRHHHTEVKDAVGYIANELLENAIKFSCKDSIQTIQIGLYLLENMLRVYITNAVDQKGSTKYQKFIERLLVEDPNEMYIRQLERNAEDENSEESGLGFLTMRIDYDAELAWNFETCLQNPDHDLVTTMVGVEIRRK